MQFSFEEAEEQEYTKNRLEKDENRVMRAYYICFILYFLQGSVGAISITMPYLYPELPSYTTLALFSMADLPFSFKFLLSPFLEKYTSFHYGKRKTWVIISQSACFSVLMLGSYYTLPAQASPLAFLLMASQFLLTIQDISLDSLSIKEIKCPERTSIVQSVASSFGVVVSSLLLLKLTSHQFAAKVGMANAVTTPDVMIKIIAAFLLITTILLHYIFTETALDCQARGKKKSICQIVSYSTMFISLRSKYCRMGLFLLIYYQGLNFYEAGYDYEMIRAGFSRDTSNSISNLIAVPVIMLTAKITQIISKLGPTLTMRFIMLLLCTVYTINTIFLPNSLILVSITQFITQTLITSKNMVIYIIIYTFPMHSFTGMFVTIFLSIWNLGQLKTLHTLTISSLGWKGCALVGIGLQLVIVLQLGNMIEWIESGTVEIDASILEDDDGTSMGIQKISMGTFVKEVEEEEDEGGVLI